MLSPVSEHINLTRGTIMQLRYTWKYLAAIGAISFAVGFSAPAEAAKKPNILVIMADDVGYWNVSHNNRGMMGYKTPNIDRIANEGLSFTDYY